MLQRCSLAILLLFAILLPIQAQDDDKPELVHFPTVDGVELSGQFYTGKSQGPVVLLLHALGDEGHRKGWFDLPKELRKRGFSVLAFDFRGHGESKTVAGETFWAVPYNKSWVKPAKASPQNIDFKNFDKRYYPALVNDIAAAKAFLDRTKNDKGVVNTSNLILVGAETGATLGALWLNSEWFRFKYTQPTMFGQQPKLDPTPEARNVVGAVWLNASPALGTRPVSISKLMELSTYGKGMPTVLLYSDQDEKGKSLAKGIEKVLKGKDDVKYHFVGAREVKGAGKLNGASLLTKSLGTDELISEYLKEVVQKKSNEWVEQDFRKSLFVWKVGPNLVPAKQPTEQVLVFDTYEKFLK